jgi:RNA polymerase sigma-70 factor (ECF subfamily)
MNPPAERAVLLLHDVFDMSHGEIAELLDKTDAACRQLLSRARENVAADGLIRRVFIQSDPERLKHVGPVS